MTDTAVFKLVHDARDTLAGRLLLRPGVTSVAVLDALMLTGEYEVFEALNRQFRFPAYFGWNWDAVYDCLADLSWISADRYLVVIENAGLLEIASDHPHGLLVDALTRAARAFLPDSTGGRSEPAEFAVLLLLSGNDETLAARLHAAGVEFEEDVEGGIGTHMV